MFRKNSDQIHAYFLNICNCGVPFCASLEAWNWVVAGQHLNPSHSRSLTWEINTEWHVYAFFLPIKSFLLLFSFRYLLNTSSKDWTKSWQEDLISRVLFSETYLVYAYTEGAGFQLHSCIWGFSIVIWINFLSVWSSRSFRLLIVFYYCHGYSLQA